MPEKMFNMDENFLFWKQMPERTSIPEQAKSIPGFKTVKDRRTVLLGGSVAGYQWKPCVIWHCENPKTLKHISEHTLTVSYRSHKQSWMTHLLFQVAILNCSASEREKYCLENDIPFSILLVTENAPRHPPPIDDLHPRVKVVLLLQPPLL